MIWPVRYFVKSGIDIVTDLPREYRCEVPGKDVAEAVRRAIEIVITQEMGAAHNWVSKAEILVGSAWKEFGSEGFISGGPDANRV